MASSILNISHKKAKISLILTLYRGFIENFIEFSSQPTTHSTLGSLIEYGGHFLLGTKSPDFIKFLRIQYKAIRKAMGYRISPPNTMLCETKIVPLHFRFNLAISRYIYKSMVNLIHLTQS